MFIIVRYNKLGVKICQDHLKLCLDLVTYVKTTYRKVASNRRSWLVAIIRVSIKGKFDVYVQ
jgi:hypothetical protein